MSRPNVLVIQRILPPYRMGFFQSLSRSEKLNVSVACGEASVQSSLESVLDAPGIQIERVTNGYIGKGEKLITQRGVLPLLRSGSYDVVIAEFNPRIVTNLLAMRQAKKQGIKFIWWGHGIRPSGRQTGFYRQLATSADALIFYSQEGKDRFVELGTPAKKLFVAWNSIETDEIDALSAAFDPVKRDGILYIGRLIPEKKPELLLRAFAKAVAEKNLAANLIFVGEGSERHRLESLAAEFGLQDRIVFVGGLYGQSELAPHFNRARLSVSPGYIGLSAIHSMAYGLPMLVADKEPHSPEIAAIKEGINARFFSADDVTACAESLTQMYGNEEALSAMSRAARQTVREQFSLNAMVKGFEQAIDYVIECESPKKENIPQ